MSRTRCARWATTHERSSTLSTGFDCFHVGRLTGTTGRVWQYTAIDLATSYVWAELATTPLNPSARKTSALARRVAAGLATSGKADARERFTVAPALWSMANF